MMIFRGWVMHDEAVSHYRDDLLQLQLGQAWLWTEFKVKPQSVWLIDPFGHSPTTPLFYPGMKGAVINRIHRDVREARKAKKDLEFFWQPKWLDPSIRKYVSVILYHIFISCLHTLIVVMHPKL